MALAVLLTWFRGRWKRRAAAEEAAKEAALERLPERAYPFRPHLSPESPSTTACSTAVDHSPSQDLRPPLSPGHHGSLPCPSSSLSWPSLVLWCRRLGVRSSSSPWLPKKWRLYSRSYQNDAAAVASLRRGATRCRAGEKHHGRTSELAGILVMAAARRGIGGGDRRGAGRRVAPWAAASPSSTRCALCISVHRSSPPRAEAQELDGHSGVPPWPESAGHMLFVSADARGPPRRDFAKSPHHRPTIAPSMPSAFPIHAGHDREEEEGIIVIRFRRVH